jgi:hypothetical protein
VPIRARYIDGMAAMTIETLTRQLELADQLLTGRTRMLEPQDLPGRYGRVVRGLDHVLAALGCEAVLAGGWAVWRHGYVGRVTQDVDIVVPANRLDDLMLVAAVSGFELLPTPAEHWPKLRHKETGIHVDLLPEGGRPGTAARPAPTTIPHPLRLGAIAGGLRYVTLPRLVELKLAAARARDESDVVELVRANADEVSAIRAHLGTVHADYVAAFDGLVERAREQDDR